MKKIIIVHGWGGSPDACWLPWLKEELESRNFKVIIPEMPNTDEPKIEEWVPFLKKYSEKADKDTFFVGGSIGCQTIMRVLEKMPKEIQMGGIVFIAPWFNLIPEPIEEEGGTEIAAPWIKNPIDTNKVLSHTKKL